MRNGMVKIFIFLAAALIFCAGFSADGQKTKTMSRTEDPVVIKCSEFKSLLNAEIATLSLLKYEDGQFKPIPFQVDEKTRDNKFIYTAGPNNNAKEGNGLISNEDELVFMIWDAGDQAPADAKFPEGMEKGVEIELRDPVKDGKAWVYLAPFKFNRPKSDVRYARHESDGARNWVKAQRYEFAEQIGESFFDRLAMRGTDGKIGPNLADRIKARFHLEAVRGAIKLDFGESDAKGDMSAWIDGPVRVVHRNKGYVKLAVIKFEAKGGADNLFYANYFMTPIYFYLPITPSTMLSEFNEAYTIDFNKNANGMKYLDPVNPGGVILDGKMSEEEKKLDMEKPHDWYAVTGPQGNLIVRVVLDPKWKQFVTLKTYYQDDETKAEPPEDEVGQRRPGLNFANIYGIEKGSYLFFMHYMFPEKPVTVENAQDMLNLLDKPIQVSSKPWPAE